MATERTASRYPNLPDGKVKEISDNLPFEDCKVFDRQQRKVWNS